MEPLPANLPAEIRSSSVPSKMFNVLVAPGEVFDEVACAPYQSVHWRLPTLLLSLAAMMLVLWIAQQPAAAKPVVTIDPHLFAGSWPILTSLFIIGGVLCGTFWAAVVLWFISRFFLSVRVPFSKMLEVAGLSGTILLLGTIVTGLMIAASGDLHCRPSLALLVSQADQGKGLMLLDTFNFFHLWTATVLAVALSRLSAVTFKEAAFWIFGFWIILRIALIVLA